LCQKYRWTERCSVWFEIGLHVWTRIVTSF
jgi:hypothetical protein